MKPGIGTGIFLIATGAILAFAVHVRSSVIDMSAVGAILMVLGIISLLLSFILLSESMPWTRGGHYHSDYIAEEDPRLTTPHEHRRVDTEDVVYEDAAGPRVERIRRIRT